MNLRFESSFVLWCLRPVRRSAWTKVYVRPVFVLKFLTGFRFFTEEEDQGDERENESPQNPVTPV